MKPRTAFLTGHKTEVLHSGVEYFDVLIAAIEQAQYCIHFQVYIFADDETGQLVFQALARAAGRGVQVWLQVDAFGSQNLGRSWFEQAKAAGIKAVFFGRFWGRRFIRITRRMHHKIVTIDAAVALVGGLNVANPYRGGALEPPWLDYALRIEGEAAQDLSHICEKYWTRKKRKAAGATEPFWRPAHKKTTAAGRAKVKVCPTDRFRRRKAAYRAYGDLIDGSRQSLTLFAAYFLPPKRLLRKLAAAAKRGVAVRVAVAKQSDSVWVRAAERYLYPWLLKRNIRVYEWLPGMLHAKAALADNARLIIGSYNLNHLSEYSSIEMCLSVEDPETAAQLAAEWENLLAKDCEEIDETRLKKQNGLQKLFNWFAFRAVRYAMSLYYWLINRSANKRKSQIAPSKK